MRDFGNGSLRLDLSAILRFAILCSICPFSRVSSLTDDIRLKGTPMHKAQLTQKGYIQFLRWELPVPEITEFTFCLWIQSTDLTRPHSIFSYSKNERERLVRSWIAGGGKSVRLEIGGRQIVASRTNILENRWYHVCLSWENRAGLYGLWINGQLWARGQSRETVGHRIPSGGDIVLGQEYTDFDKGLEDGVEGSVLGFNLLLASTFDSQTVDYRVPSSGFASNYPSQQVFTRIPGTPIIRTFFPNSNKSRTRRDVDNISRNLTRTDREISSVRPIDREPLGLQLVKLSYVRCEIGRGSPFIGGPLMLISWSRTPVRVFGGAILKNVKSECGNF